ncbi:hypothetical protein AAY473_026564 [Plecturocebus cupreus]
MKVPHSLTLLPRLEYTGVISGHCNLRLLASSSECSSLSSERFAMSSQWATEITVWERLSPVVLQTSCSVFPGDKEKGGTGPGESCCSLTLAPRPVGCTAAQLGPLPGNWA